MLEGGQDRAWAGRAAAALLSEPRSEARACFSYAILLSSAAIRSLASSPCEMAGDDLRSFCPITGTARCGTVRWTIDKMIGVVPPFPSLYSLVYTYNFILVGSYNEGSSYPVAEGRRW